MFAALKTAFTAAAAALFGLTLTACATPQYAEAPALWVARDADSTVYFLGTVHVLKPDTQWRDARIDAAMAESTELWLEMIAPTDPEEAAMVMMPLMLRHGLSPARPLSSLLTEDERAALAKAFAAAGMPAETVAMMEVMKPWVPAMMLMSAPVAQAGYSGDYGVETILTQVAEREGDTIRGLETMEQQIGFFAQMSEELQLDLLRNTLEDQDVGDLDAMVENWRKGRTRAPSREMRRMMNEMPELHQVLVSSRNEDWADQIETLLAGSGVHFIAVGAGHFEGPDNVLEKLNARGIATERL